ncbi:MAG: hypothetical protein OXR73_35950 [Myxococcales bacterium]|nr:hypothetical protein [Myxococcales bacterium]
MRRWLAAVLLLLLLFLLGACQDDLRKITLIDQMSVLGARVGVVGEPERSSAVPGEEVDYELALVFPQLDRDRSTVTTLAIDCTAPTRFTGIPLCQEIQDLAASDRRDSGGVDLMAFGEERQVRCEGQAFAFRSGPVGLACHLGEPRLRFAIPADVRGDERLVRGIVCSDGAAVLDPDEPALFRCEANDGGPAPEAQPFYGTIQLVTDGVSHNQHPDPAGLSIQFAGAVWEPWDRPQPPAGSDCDGRDVAALPVAAPGQDARIDLRYRAQAREDVDGVPEILEISTYATAGELERRFTVWKPDSPVVGGRLAGDFEWIAPSKADLAGQTWRSPEDPVHFFFTIIDRRGGFAMAERYLCVK